MAQTLKIQNRISSLPAFLALMMLTVGCGFTPATSSQEQSATYASSAGMGSSAATGQTTSTALDTASGQQPYTFPIRGMGYNIVVLASVTTSKVLKVSFTAHPQDTPDSTGQVIPYSVLGVYIKVGSTTENSGMVSNGVGSGEGPQTGNIIDFSNAIPPCASGQVGCRQQVSIAVSKPNDDFYCFNDSGNCPFTQVPAGQPWYGVLNVQTDSTNALE